jgi:gliding motility-associated-like protein
MLHLERYARPHTKDSSLKPIYFLSFIHRMLRYKYILSLLLCVALNFSFAQNNASVTNEHQHAEGNPHHLSQTETEWDDLTPTSIGGYWGLKNHKYFLLDKRKKKISSIDYDLARDFAFGKAAVHKEGKWGFIDRNGTIIIPLAYDFVFDFKSTSTAVKKNNHWELIDSEGLLITPMDIDYFWGFEHGKAKITKGNKHTTIDSLGKIEDPLWHNHSIISNKNNAASRPIPVDNFTFCPPNFDFEFCDFTNWTCYAGDYDGGFLTLNQSPVTPNQHTIINQGAGIDNYGGFSTNPPDGSSCAMRLGNPIPGAGAEQVEYYFQIPPTVTDYTFMYQYALVFEDPGHSASVQPKFRVQLTDLSTGQIVECASVDYTAGYGGASFFQQSPSDPIVSFKPWTPVFINLGRFNGRPMKITFTTMDCGLGGHWCYAYVDINTCDFTGVSANNSCSTPTTTTLQGPPGFTSYVWSTSPTLSNPIGTTQNIVMPPPGLSTNSNVYLQLIPQNGAACSDTLSVLVTPFTVRASFPALPPQCLRGNSFNFNSLSISNGGPISNYVWNFDDGSPPGTTANLTHSFPRSDTFQVQLQTTTTDGCVDDTTIDVIVLSSPQLRVNGTNICAGTSPLVTLTGGDTYVWSPLNGLSFTSPVRDSVYFGINNNTPYTITTTDTTSGCDMDSIIQINYYPNPSADFAQPSPQCLRSNNFIFTNTSTFATGPNNVSYLWTFGDDSTSTQFSTNHSYDTAGTYLVNLFAVSPDGCRDTIQKQITVHAHPSSNIFANGPLRFCYKDSVALYAIAQAGSGTIASYQWYNYGSPINGANQTSIIIDTTSSIQLVIENTNGCKDTSLNQPVIAHPLPKGNIQTNPPSTDFICDGNTVEIKVTQSTATTYQWYYTDLAGSFPPRIIPGADSASIQASIAGQYSLALTTSTIPACYGFAEDTVTLRLIKKPNPSFTFPTYCAGIPIRFNNTSDYSQSGPTNWIWNFGDLSPESTVFNPIHTYAVGTNYVVSLTAFPYYCPELDSTITQLINIEEPVKSIRYPAINAVQSINTPLQSRTFADFYNWTPGVGLVNGVNNIPNPIFNYNRQTEYLIQLQTIAGCKTVDTQLVRVFVVPDIQVPTAFTPNGDGHNDGLDVFTIGLDRLNFFRIFNRWGQLLYETTDPRKKWNGTFKTNKQPAETYVWIGEGVDQKGNVIRRRGQFILIR